MKRSKLTEALNEISDRHIAEAAKAGPKKKFYWLGALAAVLAIVILLNNNGIPLAIHAKAVSTASEPRITDRPRMSADDETWDAWWDERDQREDAANAARTALVPFFAESTTRILTGTQGENRIYSPVNTYIGLAMAAELASGDSRQQLLDALGTDTMDALHTQVSAVWETCYADDNDKCMLANSLWLDSELSYSQNVMDDIAYHYYASVYQGDLESSGTSRAIGGWLDNHTGGLLKNSTQKITLPENAVLALYSTIYLSAKWDDEFNPTKNTTGTFHAPSGDLAVTFMNMKEAQMTYYWGESFGAVSKSLKNGCTMWFILPDEDKTVDDVLAEGQFMDMVTAGYDPETYENIWTNEKYMKVNLSVPKFDIQSQVSLKEGLESMGITDVFDPYAADFSQSIEGPVWLTAANQSAHVKIDEQGVEAAVYIEFPGAGAAEPPQEIIDFILDRPFLFVITKSNLPLFTGVVNQP